MCEAREQGEGLPTTTDLGLVDVVVVPFVGTSNGHYHKVLFSVQAKVVYRGFEQVCIGAEPLGQVDRREEAHVVQVRDGPCASSELTLSYLILVSGAV